MKTLITALTLGSLIGTPAFVRSVNAAPPVDAARALFVAQTSSFMQIRSAAHERSQVAQFCVPSEPDVDAHRIYCRNGDG